MTAMLAPEVLRRSSLFSIGSLGSEVKPKITWAKKTAPDGSEKDVLSVTDQPVFRSGTFRDSWGIQTTWEQTHIDQMVFNYDYLVQAGIFSDVPVRKGHGAIFDDPMNTLVGWHAGLRAEKRESNTDGQEYNYLLASYDLFDEEAQKRVAAGDWRNRSAEVGYFLTNNEAEHWPVFQGFAFVDIPAVEGLNNHSKTGSPNKFSIFMESEVPAVGTTPTPTTPPSPPALHNQATDPAPAPAGTAPATEPVAQTGEPAAPAPVAPAAEVVAPIIPASEPQTHGAAATPGAFAFAIRGQQTNDYAAVQAHITALETVVAETTEANRADFVKGLAAGDAPKILASQIDDLSEFAQSLTPEQYAKWSATYEAAPASSLLGQHGADQGENGGTPAASAAGADAAEKSQLVGIVSMHRSNGMKEEKVKMTTSYKRLSQIAPDEYPA